MGGRGLTLKILAFVLAMTALVEAVVVLHLSAKVHVLEDRTREAEKTVGLQEKVIEKTEELCGHESRLVTAYGRVLENLLERLEAAPEGSAAQVLLEKIGESGAGLD